MYARRLGSNVRGDSSLTDNALATHSREHVALRLPYDTFHFLTNFDYGLKGTIFEQRFQVQTGSKLFNICHFVDIFGITTRQQKELLV